MLKYTNLYTAIITLFATCCTSSINAIEKINPQQSVVELLFKEPPLNLPSSRKIEENIQELWLEQKLNHFDEDPQNNNDNRTWLMRYFCNDKYFKPGGPMLIFVGGEWQISEDYLRTGLLYDLAQEHNGMLYYTEHRFYGKSVPMSDTSIENLKYLNVEQALADLAHFILEQKSKNKNLTKSKVVLVGGSYAGSMVAWFAKLYPNLVSASWASSAPLLAKMDFHEYMEIVGKSIQGIGGSVCYKKIQNAMESLERMMRGSEAQTLLERLKICENFQYNNELDMAAFFNGIGNYFAAIVQVYSRHINSMCDLLISLQTNDVDDDDVEAMIEFIKLLYWPKETKPDDWCLDLSFEGMKQIYNNANTDARQWFYQTCNEFGWYTTTAQNAVNNTTNFATTKMKQQHEQQQQRRQPFATQVTLYYFQQLCYQVFGSTYTLHNISLGVHQTNDMFASVFHAPPNKVFFTHGHLDPWRAVGLQTGQNVIVIPGYSHTADLTSININDTVAMNVAKLKVATFMSHILRDN